MKKANRVEFAFAESLLVVVALGLVCFTGWFVWHAKQNTDKTFSDTVHSQPALATAPKVTDFTGCKSARGSKLLETYPLKCSTIGGKTFTDTIDTFILPQGWSWYEVRAVGFKVAYPNSWGMPQFTETAGKQGYEYSLFFHSAPRGIADGIIATIQLDTTDLIMPGCNDASGCHDYPMDETAANLSSTLKNVKLGHTLGSELEVVVHKDASSFITILTNTGEGETDVLDGKQLISIPRNKIEVARVVFEKLNVASQCTQKAVPADGVQPCIIRSDVDNVSTVLKSVQAL